MSAWEARVRALYCHSCPQLCPESVNGVMTNYASSILGSLKRVSHLSQADGDMAAACSQLELLTRQHCMTLPR